MGDWDYTLEVWGTVKSRFEPSDRRDKCAAVFQEAAKEVLDKLGGVFNKAEIPAIRHALSTGDPGAIDALGDGLVPHPAVIYWKHVLRDILTGDFLATL